MLPTIEQDDIINMENVNDDFITPEGVKEITEKLIEQGKINHVAIFIDFDNMYYSLRDYGIDINNSKYNICKFLADVYNVNITRKFRAFADFQQIDVNLTELQESRVQIRHVYGNNKEEKFRKNASDIELSLDAIETLYKNPDIDTYIFVTCDSDMIPVMSRLKYKGKQVHLYYIGANIAHAQHITTYADVAYDIMKIFKIDPERSGAEYWIEKAIDIFKAWEDNPNHKDMYYGGVWVQNDIVEQLNVSRHLAGEIFNLLLQKKIVKKIELNDTISYQLTENYQEMANKI